MKFQTHIIILACAGTIAGCSKEESKKVDAAAPPSLTSAVDMTRAVEQVKVKEAAAAPAADKSVGFDSYQEIMSGKQMMFAYYALSGMPLDYEKIAESISSEYSDSSDVFKKKDILTKLTPGIQAEVEKAKTTRYFWMNVSDSLQPFDMSTKSFALTDSTKSGSYFTMSGGYRFNQYKLTWNNGQKFGAFKIEDEGLARTIESMRSGYSPFRFKIYFFMSDVELGTKNVRAEITKIELLDQKDRLLSTM